MITEADIRTAGALPAEEATPPRRGLRRVGLLSAAVYLLDALFYLGGPQAHTRTAREVCAWLTTVPLLYLFWKGYRLVSDSAASVSAATVVRFVLPCVLLAAATYPFHSTDVFGYINRGWQQVHYGQNPYVYALSEVPDWQQDPMLKEHWLYNPNPYGFLFTLLARAICRLGGGNWWLTLTLFKAVNALAYAGTGALIWRGARLLGQRRPVVALYLFLWNPLVLLHHLANGHNDLLTGACVILALYLAARGAWLWVVPALVAATLLKYAPAVLVPLALWLAWKQKGWRVAALSALLGALIALAVSAPYLQDWRHLRLADIQTNATLIDNSLHSLLIHLFENAARLLPALAPLHDAVNTAIKLVLRLGFLVFFTTQAYALCKRPTARVLLEKSVLVLFALICVASSKFNAWYMGMLLPPALLLPERHWLRQLVVLISCAELLSLTFFKQAYMLNYCAMILLPCLIVYRRWRRERAASL